MNSDRATSVTVHGARRSTIAYACSVDECSNSSEIRETTGEQLAMTASQPVNQGHQQSHQNSSGHQGQRNLS